MDAADAYVMRSLAAALDRVQRQHADVLGDITLPIVRRALALTKSGVAPPRTHCVAIDEGRSSDDSEFVA